MMKFEVSNHQWVAPEVVLRAVIDVPIVPQIFITIKWLGDYCCLVIAVTSADGEDYELTKGRGK